MNERTEGERCPKGCNSKLIVRPGRLHPEPEGRERDYLCCPHCSARFELAVKEEGPAR